jgi:hypothetical protein
MGHPQAIRHDLSHAVAWLWVVMAMIVLAAIGEIQRFDSLDLTTPRLLKSQLCIYGLVSYGFFLADFLLDHAETQMDRFFRFDHFYRFELNGPTTYVLVKSRAAAEQYGDKVNKNFVNEPECDKLCCRVTTVDENVLIACRFFGYFKCGFNIVDKCVHTTLKYILGHVV